MLFIAGLLLAYLIYWPGLSGSFIFDDFNNLGTLGARGGISDFESLRHYVFSGFSGPTGRPVALLSFLLDDNAWPSEPGPFKYTNILIHLLNGALLFALQLTLLRFYEGSRFLSRHAKWAALLVTLFWLCHPYLVSTTLYVVQRMAQLVTLFVFCGLLAWLRGRRIVGYNKVAGYLWMTLGLGLFGLLAIFSKENGALLPVLALVCEVFVVARSPLAGRLNKSWRNVFLVAPACLILLYLLYVPFVNGWFANYPGRDFTPWQRVLTECRVLWEYLYNWFFPRFFSTGIYNDTLVVSMGFLRPWTTLLSLFGLVILVAAAWRCRRRWQLVSLAVFLFLTSQLVESTTIRLELLFEHRVYMGSGFLFLPLVYYGLKHLVFWKGLLLSVVWLGVLAFFCWRGAMLWGDYPSMVMVWVEKNPESPRAQVEAARMLFNRGYRPAAVRQLNQASDKIPDDFFLRMTQVLIQCKEGALCLEDKADVLALAKTKAYSSTWLNVMQKGLDWTNRGDCSSLAPGFMLEIAEGFLSQPVNAKKESVEYAQLSYIRGVSLFLLGRKKEAKMALFDSIKEVSSLDRMMSVASYFATYGYFDDALQVASTVEERLLEGGLRGRALAEAPEISDVEFFIHAVENRQDEPEHSGASKK